MTKAMGALGGGRVDERAVGHQVSWVIGAIFSASGDETSATILIDQSETETVLRADVCFEAHFEYESRDRQFRSLADVEAFDAGAAMAEYLREARPVFYACLERLKAAENFS